MGCCNTWELRFCSAFIQEFRNWESAWALEALYVVAYEIRILAEKVCITYFLNVITKKGDSRTGGLSSISLL